MDRRRQRRFCTEVMGWARNAALENHTVVIADISATGCRILDNQAHVAVGERVVLSILEREPVAATVRWIKAGALGVEFDEALEHEVVMYLASLRRDVA